MLWFPAQYYIQLFALRIDIVSLLIGIVLGAGGYHIAVKLRPRIARGRLRVAERVKGVRGKVQSTIETRFREEVVEYLESYHSLPTIPLSKLYVPFALRAPDVATLDVPTGPSLSVLSRLWPELAAGIAVPPEAPVTIEQVLRNAQLIAISSAAGNGKSTLLAHVARCCALAEATAPPKPKRGEEPQPRDPFRNRIPLFLHCAELDVTDGKGVVEAPQHVLTHALQRRTGRFAARTLDNYLNEQLATRRPLLLLDGWDELPIKLRDDINRWLRHLVAAYPQLQIMVASPLRGYGSLMEMGFVVVDLLPGRLGHAGALGEKVRREINSEKQIFTQTYWNPGQTVLDTLLRLQYALDDEEVPVRQADLFERRLQTLLAGEERDPDWLPAAARRVWTHVAVELLNQPAVAISASGVTQFVERTLQELNINDLGAANRIKRSLTRSGIFIQWPDGSVSVRTPVWRDMLTAIHLANSGPIENVDLHSDDPAWAGVRRFFAGLIPGNQLALTMLYSSDSAKRQRGLFEVASWMSEVKMQGEWQRQVLKQIGQLTVDPRQPMPMRQRAIAAISQTGDRTVLALLKQLLLRPESEIRQAAVASLINFPDETTVNFLQRALMEEQEVDVRLTIVDALAWIPHHTSEAPLVKLLVGEDALLSQSVARHLALKGGDGWQMLQEGLLESDPQIRRAVTFGLEMLEEEWAQNVLDNVRQDDDEWMVRSAANAALEEVKKRQVTEKWVLPDLGEQSWLIYWAAQRRRAVPTGMGALPVILDALDDEEDEEVQHQAANLLGQLALNSARQSIERVMRTSDGAVQASAFHAVHQIDRAHPL